MSATNRGAKRVADDFYATQPWVVERFLEAWPDVTAYDGCDWVEPGAGDGAIIRAVNSIFDREELARPEWTAVEINPGRRKPLEETGAKLVAIGDVLKFDPFEKFAVAMGNPAFAIAMDVIAWCRAHARHTALLLRLDFLGSAKRAAFMRGDMPDVFVLPNRPSFVISAKCPHCAWSKLYAIAERDRVPDGCPECDVALAFSTTDSCDYAWFTWNEQRKRVGSLYVLEETPESERSVWGAK